MVRRTEVWRAEGTFMRIGTSSALQARHFKLLKAGGSVLVISASLGERSMRNLKEAVWSATKHATLRWEPSCAGRWNTMDGSPRKRNRREKISQTKALLPLWAYLPCSLHQHWSLLSKEHNKTYFFLCHAAFSWSYFVSKIMNFMGLSHSPLTGLTAYEELPRNMLGLFCSLPHVSEGSQNNNRAIKMTFTHSLIIIFLFFHSVLSWELFISWHIRLLKPGSNLHYFSLITKREIGCSDRILLSYL